MWLRRIEIQGFRNITHAELNPCNGYNLITGSNASGKSSILEAIHCLSTGRSFRTNKKLPIIQNSLQEATIFGEVSSQESISRAGLQKRRDGSSFIKLDGRNLDSQIELALLLPIIGSTPESEDLLSEGAKVRQSYLDWTLFHVEQSFRELWRNYRRVLQQRNRALKGRFDAATIRSWDNSLITLGTEVDRLRKETLGRLIPVLVDSIQELLPNLKISFSFRQGWPKEHTLADALTHSFEMDRKMGFTHSGPHRADVAIKSEPGPLTQTLSRGQKKLLTLALKIAQAKDYQRQTGRLPILYVDDLPAELDSANRQLVLRSLLALNMQLFVTATSPADVDTTVITPDLMFHVEQGRVMNMV